MKEKTRQSGHSDGQNLERLAFPSEVKMFPKMLSIL